MIRFVVGFAVGYILGARAGRERYEQIARLARAAKGSPAIQGAAGFVVAKATNILPGRKNTTRRPDRAYLPDEAEAPTI